jgi:hypothetical protein
MPVHGQPFTICPRPAFLSIQAEEGRRAFEAKVAEIIKEAILFFSGLHLFLFCKKLLTFNTFYPKKSTEKMSNSVLNPRKSSLY